MSYDLMVFEREKAPSKQKDFLDWYEKETEWTEDHGYNDPTVSSPALQEWYREMIKTFPNMNGPDAPTNEQLDEDEDLESHLTDYAIGRNVIYAAFSWSTTEEAYELTKRLAQKHGVGFFDVSGTDGDIFLPDGSLMK